MLVANLHNHNAAMCIEVGRQNTPTHNRPGFSELEEALKELKQAAAMTRFLKLISALIVLASPAFAQEVTVRSGEHAGFTRLVFNVPPDTGLGFDPSQEWGAIVGRSGGCDLSNQCGLWTVDHKSSGRSVAKEPWGRAGSGIRLRLCCLSFPVSEVDDCSGHCAGYSVAVIVGRYPPAPA